MKLFYFSIQNFNDPTIEYIQPRNRMKIQNIYIYADEHSAASSDPRRQTCVVRRVNWTIFEVATRVSSSLTTLSTKNSDIEDRSHEYIFQILLFFWVRFFFFSSSFFNLIEHHLFAKKIGDLII